MSRLIIISNRVHAPGGPDTGAQGGLAVALQAALKEHRGIWFGWSGERTDHYTGQITFQRGDGVTTATVDLEDQDIEEYYNGFANRTLWPLFHYRIDLTEYERGFADGYKRVNERLAETVRPLASLMMPYGFRTTTCSRSGRPYAALAPPTAWASSCTFRGRHAACSRHCRRLKNWCALCSPMTSSASTPMNGSPPSANLRSTKWAQLGRGTCSR